MESNQDTSTKTPVARAITKDAIKEVISVKYDAITKSTITKIVGTTIRRDSLDYALIISDDKPTLAYCPASHCIVLQEWTAREIITYALDRGITFFQAFYILAYDFVVDMVCDFVGVE